MVLSDYSEKAHIHHFLVKEVGFFSHEESYVLKKARFLNHSRDIIGLLVLVIELLFRVSSLNQILAP